MRVHLEMDAIMERIRQAALTHSGIAFKPSSAASEIAVGKGRRAEESALTDEEMPTLTTMLQEHGVPQGIRLKDARL